MKHIKQYEETKTIKSKYNNGDYILINIPHDYSGSLLLTKFINNNIGILIDNGSVNADRVGEKGDENNLVWLLEIKYNNIPDNIKKYFMNSIIRTSNKYIVAIGKNISDVETILNAKKYNL